MATHPLKFVPILKHRIWGGQALKTVLGKPCPPDDTIGESWELADLPDDKSVVDGGPMAGRTLDQLVEEWGTDLYGRAELFQGSFPLLIKFLDAQTDLSVQVHPDPAMAERLGVRIKHEAWYIIDCMPDAVIYRGLKPGVTREQFATAVAAGRCAELLERIPIKPGQCYYLPSGTVHALGAGVLVAEIQTPSDITYRVFDWNRTDPTTGRGRDLHINEALECIHFGPFDCSAEQRSHVASYWTTVTRLVSCASFRIEKVRMVGGLEQAIPYAEPVVWIVLEGSGEISYRGGAEPVQFRTGETVLLPAALEQATLKVNEDSVWLEVTLPSESDLAGFAHPPRESDPGDDPAPIQIGLPPR